jgi:hypothetical protein
MRYLTTALLLMTLTVVAASERRDVGLTQKNARIEAIVVAGQSEESPTVLLIGGLSGNDESSRIVTQEVQK